MIYGKMGFDNGDYKDALTIATDYEKMNLENVCEYSDLLPGFLMIAACVMTLEARDNAAKIVPAAAQPEEARSHTNLHSF